MAKKNAHKIAEQITALVSQLVQMAGTGQQMSPALAPAKHGVGKSPKRGAAGALGMLINEGFFDKPKDLSTVVVRLKEIGHYHQRPAEAMNLLNLTKRRTLNRFKNPQTKNWEYVIRR